MPRVAVSVTAAGRTGTRELTMVAGDATNHHEFVHGNNYLLLVNNGGGASITVTVQAPQTVDGMALPGLAVTVGAGKEAIIGPFPERVYKQADGKVYVNLSAATSVKLAVIGA